MQEAIHEPTIVSGAADPLVAAAFRAEAWAGEPFFREGEDAAQVLAPGTARRRALDDALAEIEAGQTRPTPQWKVRYALMLGLERVLAEPVPRTAAGTELRRHQIDALAGMLTELIAAMQRDEEPNGNGNGHALSEDELAEVEEEEADEDATSASRPTSSWRPRTRSSRKSCRPRRIPAPSAATASAIPPRPARRSPPPASSKARARRAS